MKNKVIGFIGLGNMASAIIGGMLQKEMVAARNVIGYDVSEAARKNAEEKFGIAVAAGNKEAASKADILFLAVKPIFMAEVIGEIKEGEFTTLRITVDFIGKIVTAYDENHNVIDSVTVSGLPLLEEIDREYHLFLHFRSLFFCFLFRSLLFCLFRSSFFLKFCQILFCNRVVGCENIKNQA